MSGYFIQELPIAKLKEMFESGKEILVFSQQSIPEFIEDEH